MSSRKRKIAVLATIFSLALFGIGYGVVFPTSALAWDNCPKGLVNDPYPGACRKYVDTNSDGICDLSQSKPADTTTTTALAVATTTSGEPPTGDCPLGPCAGCGACLSTGVSANAISADAGDDSATSALLITSGSAAALAGTDSATTSTTTPPSGGTTSDAANAIAAAESVSASVAVATGTTVGGSMLTHYLVSPIAIGFILIYGVSFFLYKTKRIKMATHRKIWNSLLAATFLITGIFGTILAFQLDYAPLFSWPINLLFWHVEAGIVMTFISLFHLGWHFKYYKSILKNAREKWRLLRNTQKEFDVRDEQLVLEAREARRSAREARKTDPGLPAAPRPARVAQLAERGVPVAVRVEKVRSRRPYDFELE